MTTTAHEEDYRRQYDAGPTQFLPGTSVEVVRSLVRRRPPRHVLFDFDGTLSLIREGWPEVMVPMMVEVLQAASPAEPPEQLRRLVFGFIMELNGKQTIYQMLRLAEEVRRRGGEPEDPQVYKDRYHQRLMARIAGRRAALESGQSWPEDALVPCTFELLAELRRRGATLYLASGTDERYVVEEARLLRLDAFFGPRVYGAVEDYRSFSKAMVIERILCDNRIAGEELLGFGDGYVEVQNIKAVGGIAVAVASDEAGRSGRPDPWKRDRLIGVGADLVVPDYRDWQPLNAYLWGV